MSTYSVYGITFSSSVSFRSPLLSSTGSPSLHITEKYGTIPLEGAEVVVSIPTEYWNLAAPQAIYRKGRQEILHFAQGNQIVVEPEQMTYIHAEPETIRTDLLNVRLLGVAFAWWMLRQGRIPFHAGAVVIDGQAVMFSAITGTGKSSLMCSLLRQGIPLLSDDFVAVHLFPQRQLLASSAYPQMRLWPASIEQFVGSPEDYPPVFDGGRKRRVQVGENWGTFLPGSFPVGRIYLLERRNDDHGPIKIDKFQGHEAFMELLTMMTMGAIFPVDDFDRIWSVLQQVVMQVPVYQLSYPSGWQWLPAVQQAILDPLNL